MKKLILIASFIALGTTAAKAQDTFHFGVKGGVNFANIAGDDSADQDSRTSFYAGLVAELPISEMFSIQPEVIYSAQGSTIAAIDEDNFLDVDDNIEYQLDYIQVPLMAKIYLADGLSLQAGPSFNFLVSEEIDNQPTSASGDIDIVNGANDFEFGTAAGLEYQFDSGLFIQGRYTRGFTKIYDNVNAYNYAIQAGVGFVF
ncbi:porin family protein [Leeuwenhoekiella polynyae]|uniref:Outer membrane protein with beta-barrel domain n=1 Tax=Leeuwenhoekiella polynyae TaxID=1550906 RepID=A0A4Q0NY66_9FLAO|nr:porin family protein [Leeuwenhoekiella polynyae]RXG17727.1 outer membrane protein with beta-barrel domain [Leeuwenhoekiella polynyae]|eukprot:TRINITY_DN26705_c0_g1_i1.p1 TRINITY_DN26705_c0_g1~~TRINITY_DN26705_c0_g1_i1.p1  ORF type:complete len:201 (-),score=1.84 TRINITY_DN26705_c0_g1_i1:37-639(-)